MNSNGQLSRMKRVTNPQPGDLAFFGASATNTTHVAVYIGNGQMIESPRTGLNIRKSSVSSHGGLIGFYRY